jgi:hypothetical protein
MILNWTPHIVRVYGPDLQLLAELQPAAYTPRLAERVEPAGKIDGLPLVRVVRDRLAAPLPVPPSGTRGVVVGDLVAPAVRAALDQIGLRDIAVLTPATGPGWAIRRTESGELSDAPDAKGIVWGVKALALYVKE